MNNPFAYYGLLAIPNAHPDNKRPGRIVYGTCSAATDKSLVGPLALMPEAAQEWIRQDSGGKEAETIISDGQAPADYFICHPVIRSTGNIKIRGRRG